MTNDAKAAPAKPCAIPTHRIAIKNSKDGAEVTVEQVPDDENGVTFSDGSTFSDGLGLGQ